MAHTLTQSHTPRLTPNRTRLFYSTHFPYFPLFLPPWEQRSPSSHFSALHKVASMPPPNDPQSWSSFRALEAFHNQDPLYLQARRKAEFAAAMETQALKDTIADKNEELYQQGKANPNWTPKEGAWTPPGENSFSQPSYEGTYRRTTPATPRSTSSSDITLQPYRLPFPANPAWNDSERRAVEQLAYAVQAKRNVSGGSDPVLEALKHPDVHTLLREKKLPLDVLGRITTILEQARRMGTAPGALQNQLSAATSSTGVGLGASPTVPYPTYSEQLQRQQAIQSRMDALYKDTARQLGVSEALLRQRLPELSDEQLSYVESPSSTRLASGGPGTGKGTTLTWTFARAVARGQVRPQEVFFTAATNTSTDALRQHFSDMQYGKGGSKGTPLLSSWNFDLAREQQFRTQHAYALSQLYYQPKDANGQPMQSAMERLGKGGFTIAGGSPRNLNDIDALLAQGKNQRNALIGKMFESEHEDGPRLPYAQGYYPQKYSEYISQTKTALSFEERRTRYTNGKRLFEQGQKNHPDAVYYRYETVMSGSKQIDLDDPINLFVKAASQGLVRQVKMGVFDEIQDNSYSQMAMARAMVRPGGTSLYAGDMGQGVMANSGRTDRLLSQFHPELATVELHNNYRSPAWVVAQTNVFNMAELMQQAGTAPLQVAMGKNRLMGQSPSYTVRQSLPELHEQVAQKWFGQIGVTRQQMNFNVEHGYHPLSGATLPPVEVPIIVQMKEEREKILEAIRREVVSAVGAEKADRVMEAINPTGRGSYRSPGTENLLSILTVPQSKGHQAAVPFISTAHVGAWDDLGHLRNMMVATSRATDSVHYFHATQPQFTRSTANWNNAADFDPELGNLPRGFAGYMAPVTQNMLYGQEVPLSDLPGAYQAYDSAPYVPSVSVSQVTPEMTAGLQRVSSLASSFSSSYREPIDGSGALRPADDAGIPIDYDEDTKRAATPWGYRSGSLEAAAGHFGADQGTMEPEYQAGLVRQLLTGGPQALNLLDWQHLVGTTDPAKVSDPSKRLLPTLSLFPTRRIPGSVSELDAFTRPLIGMPGGRQKDAMNAVGLYGGKDLDYPAPTVEDLGAFSQNDFTQDPKEKYRQEAIAAKKRKADRTALLRSRIVSPGDLFPSPFMLSQFYPEAGSTTARNPLSPVQGVFGGKPGQAYDPTFFRYRSEEERQLRDMISGALESESFQGTRHGMSLLEEQFTHPAVLAEVRKRAGRLGQGDPFAGLKPGDELGQDQKVRELVGSSRIQRSGILSKAAWRASQQELTPELFNSLLGAAHQVIRNPHASAEERADAVQFVRQLHDKFGYAINHDEEQGGNYTPTKEQLAGQYTHFQVGASGITKSVRTRTQALLHAIFLGKQGDKSFLRSFRDPSVLKATGSFAHTQGSVARNAAAMGPQLRYSMAQSAIAPFSTELAAMADRQFVDPQAVQYLRNGEVASLGRGATLDQLARRYRDLGDTGGGKNISSLRRHLTDPQWQEQAGHTLAAVMRTTTGAGAFKRGDGKDNEVFDQFFAPQREGLRGGTRTIEGTMEFIDAVNEATRHMQEMGGLKRGQVDRVLSAMGHDPADRQMFKMFPLLAREWGSAESNLPLAAALQTFNRGSQNEQLKQDVAAQLTRVPLQQGRTYRFMGGAEGYPDIVQGNQGLETGMEGTLLPWDPQKPEEFGYSRDVVNFREANMMSHKWEGAEPHPDSTPSMPKWVGGKPGVNEINRSQRLPDESVYGVLARLQVGKHSFPVRADQLALPEQWGRALAPLIAPGSFGMSSQPAYSWTNDTPSSTSMLRSQSRQPDIRMQYDPGHVPDQSHIFAPSPDEVRNYASQFWKRQGGMLAPRHLEKMKEAMRESIQKIEHPIGSFSLLTDREGWTEESRQHAAARQQLGAELGYTIGPYTRNPYSWRAEAPILAYSPPSPPLSSSSSSPLSPEESVPEEPEWMRDFMGVKSRGEASQRRKGSGTSSEAVAPPIRYDLDTLHQELFGGNTPSEPPPPTPVATLSTPPSTDTSEPPPSLAQHMQDITQVMLHGNRHPQTGNYEFSPLSDQQRAFVTSPAQGTLLNAGPGSGKTGTMVRKGGYLASQHGILPSQQMYVSYMRSGVDELTKRLFGDKRKGVRGIQDFFPKGDQYRFNDPRTVHSLGWRILMQGANWKKQKFPVLKEMGIPFSGKLLIDPNDADRYGLSQEDWAERVAGGQTPFLKDVMTQARGGKPPDDEDVKKMLSFVGKMKSGGTYDPQQDPEKGKEYLGLYEQARKAGGHLDPADLLTLSDQYIQQKGVKGLPRAMRGIRSLFFDEAQDNTKAGHSLLRSIYRALSGDHPTHLVAGQDLMQQQISESFGGLPPEAMEPLYNEMAGPQGIETHNLNVNRRSDAGPTFLTRAFNKWLRGEGGKTSEDQVVPPGTPIGTFPKFGMARTQDVLYQQIFGQMQKDTGLTSSAMVKNFRSGLMPLSGSKIDPSKMAGVFSRWQDVDLMQFEVARSLMADHHLDSGEASDIVQSMFITHPPRESKIAEMSDEEQAALRSRIQLGTPGRVRSHEYQNVYQDVTRVGGGGLLGWLKNMGIGGSRLVHGGQNYFYGATHPFPNKEAYQTYLSNPNALVDPARGQLMSSAAVQLPGYGEKGLLFPSKMNIPDRFGGGLVPAGFGTPLVEHLDMLAQAGYTPDNPENAAYLQAATQAATRSHPPSRDWSAFQGSVKNLKKSEIAELSAYQREAGLVSFGKHRGSQFKDIPDDYLRWITDPEVHPKGFAFQGMDWGSIAKDILAARAQGHPEQANQIAQQVAMQQAYVTNAPDTTVHLPKGPGSSPPLGVSSSSSSSSGGGSVAQQAGAVNAPLQVGQLTANVTGSGGVVINATPGSVTARQPTAGVGGTPPPPLPPIGTPPTATSGMGGGGGGGNTWLAAIAQNQGNPPPAPSGGGGGGYGGYSRIFQVGRSVSAIGSELSSVGQTLKEHADQKILQGSEYRHATMQLTMQGTSPVSPTRLTAQQQQAVSRLGQSFPVVDPTHSVAGAYGDQGDFNFSDPSSLISQLSHNLPMYSYTQIAQGLQDYLSSTNQQYSTSAVGSSNDVLALAAVSGLSPGQLTPQLSNITGLMNAQYGNPGSGFIKDQTSQLMGMLTGAFHGNLTPYNVMPYLQSMNQVLPTLIGNTPNSLTGSVTQAGTMFQLALNSGQSAENLPQVAEATGTLSNLGSHPNLQGQYFLSNLYGEKALTASPDYWQFQQEQLSLGQQVKTLGVQQNILGGSGILSSSQNALSGIGVSLNSLAPGGKLSLPQLQINADNAQITLDKVNFQAAQFGLAQGQASFNFEQYYQTQQLGPIGATAAQTGRSAYFDFQRRQLAAGYNPLNADQASTFKPTGPVFGLQNEQFYAGVEHQRSMLVLGRSPLLADAAFQEQMKYLNKQENFYVRSLDLQNQQRAFQKDWGQRSLNMQAAQLKAQQAVVADNILFKQYDKQIHEIESQNLPRMVAIMQQLLNNRGQWIGGQGPINGGNVTPTDIVSHLATAYSSDTFAHKTGNKDNDLYTALRTAGLSPQEISTILPIIKQAAKSGVSSVEKQIAGASDNPLLQQTLQMINGGAFLYQTQQAYSADQATLGGGTDATWQQMIQAVNNEGQATELLNKTLSPGSPFFKVLGDFANFGGQFVKLLGSFINLVGLVGGGGGAGGMGTGGAGGHVGPPPGGAGIGGGEFDPLPISDKAAGFWVKLLEDIQMKKQGQEFHFGPETFDHYGIQSPHVNADFHQKMNYGIHQGVDFAAPQGSPLSEFIGGEVTGTGFYPWGGEVDVRIPGGMTERYIHLSSINVHGGQKIRRGDRIGLTGGGTPQSGLGKWSSGAHSHVQYDYGNINQGVDPWVVWLALGDRNLSSFYGTDLLAGGTPSLYGGKSGGRGGTTGLFHMYEGGIAMRPITSTLADGGEPEAVIPLSKLQQVASTMNGSSGSTTGSSPLSASSSSQGTPSVSVSLSGVNFHVHTQSATMSDQEKDQLMADAITILGVAVQQVVGKR